MLEKKNPQENSRGNCIKNSCWIFLEGPEYDEGFLRTADIAHG